MPHASKYLVAGGCFIALVMQSGCGPKRTPSMTVADLMEDRVALDGVLLKCNQAPVRSRDDSDCLNARIAIERLAKDVDPAVEARHRADFERRREQLRSVEQRLRAEQDARSRVDAYTMPVVPVAGAPADGPTAANLPKP